MQPLFDSRIVSWLSFAAMAVMVAVIGLIGNQQIVDSLEQESIAHSVGHAREIADELLPLLNEPLRSGVPAARVLAEFGGLSAEHMPLGSYSAAVIDPQAKRVLALAARGTPAAAAAVHDVENLRAIAAAAGQHGDGPSWAVHEGSYAGPVRLTYHLPVPAASGWLLAIESDITEAIASMHALHYRMSGLLLLTVGLVATFGILVLRRIGRVYERHLEEMLGRRTAELEAAHAEVLNKARLATLGQTASMLAHELRSPLAAIKLGLSGLAPAEGLGEREQRRVRLVLREVDRLGGLLTDALNVVRPVRLSGEPVPLDLLLDTVMRGLEPVLVARGLELRRSRCETCPGVRLDPAQMEQVLLNLLNNAIEASPDGGRIDVAVRAPAGAVEVEIANAGAPIPPEELTRVFEPFYTTKPNGTGLGLVLVKRVIEEHGGAVHVVSGAHEGTRVSVRLPLRAMPRGAGVRTQEAS
jgi:signal transduction histidine kinase